MKPENTVEFEPFDFSEYENDGHVDWVPMSILVPRKIKEKFDENQLRSQKQFGKSLKKIIIKYILAA